MPSVPVPAQLSFHPFEAGLALWLFFTNRMRRKWHCARPSPALFLIAASSEPLCKGPQLSCQRDHLEMERSQTSSCPHQSPRRSSEALLSFSAQGVFPAECSHVSDLSWCHELPQSCPMKSSQWRELRGITKHKSVSLILWSRTEKNTILFQLCNLHFGGCLYIIPKTILLY